MNKPIALIKDLKVKYFIDDGMKHNWKVYTDGFFLGCVHCNEDGEEFGGSLSTSAVHHIDDQETWDTVQELCLQDLVEIYLLDTMEEVGY